MKELKNYAFVLIFLACGGAAFYFDKVLMKFIMAHNQDWVLLHKACWWISHFGEGQYYLVPAGLIMGWAYWMHWTGKRTPLVEKLLLRLKRFFLLMATTAAALHVLKIIFGRPRPSAADLDADQPWHWFTLDGHWHSLPSGHAQASMAVALFLSQIYPKFCGLFYGWALLVGASRVILTKHFLGDVWAGYALSIFVFFVVLRFHKKIL